MGPPFQSHYSYFRWDADEYMKTNRVSWTRDQRADTVGTLWHGSDAIRDHYANRHLGHLTGPGLPNPNPIPHTPYIPADARHARVVGSLLAPIVQIDSDDVSGSVEDKDEHGSEHGDENKDDVEDQADNQQALSAGSQAQVNGFTDSEKHGGPENGNERLEAGAGKRKQRDVEEGVPESTRQSPTKRRSASPDDRVLQLEGRVRQLEAQALQTALERMTDTGYATLQTPLEWAEANHKPVQSEAVADWQRRRIQNKTSLMQSRLYKDLQATPEEATWRGTYFLAHGSYGVAGMWVKCDPNNCVVDRMVVKEAAARSHMWRHPDEWRDKLPREIRMHQLIDSTRTPTSHLNLVRHRGYRLMMAKSRYRIYLDLCDGGTLETALRDRWEADPMTYGSEEDPLEVLPEAYVWHLFKGMVDVCMVLDQGREDITIEDWKPLVHNDLHARNVILGNDSDNPKPLHWPRIILVDFGRTFYNLHPDRTPSVHNINETDNPILYRIPKANGRFPPEMQPAHPYATRITSKSDVWSMGMMMHAIISHAYPNEGPALDVDDRFELVNSRQFMHDDLLQGKRYPVACDKTGAYAGSTLFDWVRRCLEYDPDDRPTLTELKHHIDGALGGPQVGRMVRQDPNLWEPDPFEEYVDGKKRRSPIEGV